MLVKVSEGLRISQGRPGVRLVPDRSCGKKSTVDQRSRGRLPFVLNIETDAYSLKLPFASSPQRSATGGSSWFRSRLPLTSLLRFQQEPPVEVLHDPSSPIRRNRRLKLILLVKSQKFNFDMHKNFEITYFT